MGAFRPMGDNPSRARDLVLDFIPDEWLHRAAQPGLRHAGEDARQLRRSLKLNLRMQARAGRQLNQ